MRTYECYDATAQTPSPYLSICIGCGERFEISQEAIDEGKRTYADERPTSTEIANTTVVCEICADIKDFRYWKRLAE